MKITQEQLTESSVSKSSRVTTVILSGVERKMHLPEMSVRGRFSGNKSGTAEHSALSLKSRDEALFLYTGRGGEVHLSNWEIKSNQDGRRRPVTGID